MRILRRIPERNGSEAPDGWVTVARSPKYTRGGMTEGYLNRRMNRTNSIALNQRYVETIMENPRTSYRSRKAVVDYVLSHPEKFVPLCDSTGDPELDEYARRRNGNARRRFLDEFRDRYLSG